MELNSRKIVAVLVVSVILFSVPVLAHVPEFAGENTSPDKAYHIENSQKSWSIYDSLDGKQAKYYEIHVNKGDKLRLRLFTPTGEDVRPSLVVMSKKFTRNYGNVPEWVEVPDGYNARVRVGKRARDGEYEPFTPASYSYTVEIDRKVTENRHYLVAVYDPAKRSGPVGVAVGSSESFTPTEYTTVPIDIVREHLWQGQNPIVVFGPIIAVLLGGIVFLSRRIKGEHQVVRYVLGLGGLLMIGSSTTQTVQMFLALSKAGLTASAIVTVIFIAIPLTIGLWLLRFVTKDKKIEPSVRNRLKLVGAGVGGLATWGGLIIGPVIIVGGAVYLSFTGFTEPASPSPNN